MYQISEQDFCDSIAATKKDAKLVAAAKNDRTNSPATMYQEFEKLTVDRRREILIAIASEHFVAAQWKIAFPLNNFPAAILPDAILAVGKAMFFTREEDSVRETVRAIKLYEKSPFVKRIALRLADGADIAGIELGKVAVILTDPDVFGLIQALDPASPGSEKIIDAICRVACYTKDLGSTLSVSRFLAARRFSASLPEIATLVESSVFMARDRRSVKEIVEGFSAGSLDVVLQRKADKATLSAIGDLAWKTRSWKAIRDGLASI